jgi:hypothetical protein
VTVPDKRRAPGGAGAPLATLLPVLDRRPILVALAGSNGAGKTTFYHAHLKPAGLRFVNADEVAYAAEIN